MHKNCGQAANINRYKLGVSVVGCTQANFSSSGVSAQTPASTQFVRATSPFLSTEFRAQITSVVHHLYAVSTELTTMSTISK